MAEEMKKLVTAYLWALHSLPHGVRLPVQLAALEFTLHSLLHEVWLPVQISQLPHDLLHEVRLLVQIPQHPHDPPHGVRLPVQSCFFSSSSSFPSRFNLRIAQKLEISLSRSQRQPVITENMP